jgi:hypothetical protein
MKKMRDGDSAGFGSQCLFILLGLAFLVINAFSILFVSFWYWVRRKPMPLTPEDRQLLQHLQSLPSDRREAFLARFDEKRREHWRKSIESYVADTKS